MIWLSTTLRVRTILVALTIANMQVEQMTNAVDGADKTSDWADPDADGSEEEDDKINLVCMRRFEIHRVIC